MNTTATRIRPGIVLRSEFFAPLKLTQLAVSKGTGIRLGRLDQILSGHQGITPDAAARLGRYFRVDPRNWLNLQASFDLWKLEQDSGTRFNQAVKPFEAS